MAALLRPASSRVLLNGTPGKAITHGRGLRQGDPLSPFLFILAIDPIQGLLEAASDAGYLAPTRDRFARLRTSIYADDAAIFINPSTSEIHITTHIILNFGNATGLHTNFQKSTVLPISCDHLDLDMVLQDCPAIRSTFPIKYLRLPLTHRRLRKVDFQPLLDKVAGRLEGWQGCLLSPAGRATLVKSVLTSIPIFYLTGFKIPKEILHAIDKIRRRFLWAENKVISGAKCKVNWGRVCRPTHLGGLGILSLSQFSSAIRLRWLWLE